MPADQAVSLAGGSTADGTPLGHMPPNSETGAQEWNNSAPFAPARVWASICAGSTPSENRHRQVHEAASRRQPALDDRVEPGLLGVGGTLIESFEDPSLVQVRDMHGVTSLLQRLGETTRRARRLQRGAPPARSWLALNR